MTRTLAWHRAQTLKPRTHVRCCSCRAPEDSWREGLASIKAATAGATRVLYIGITCGLSAPFIASQLEHCRAHSDTHCTVLLGFNPPSLARSAIIEVSTAFVTSRVMHLATHVTAFVTSRVMHLATHVTAFVTSRVMHLATHVCVCNFIFVIAFAFGVHWVHAASLRVALPHDMCSVVNEHARAHG
jgi:hypothetical protein